MLRIEIFDTSLDRPRWVEIEGGPFPVTEEELKRCRAAVSTRLKALDDEHGSLMQAPQTVAREVLAFELSRLDNFDRLVLGFAMTATRIRWEKV